MAPPVALHRSQKPCTCHKKQIGFTQGILYQSNKTKRTEAKTSSFTSFTAPPTPPLVSVFVCFCVCFLVARVEATCDPRASPPTPLFSLENLAFELNFPYIHHLPDP